MANNRVLADPFGVLLVAWVLWVFGGMGVPCLMPSCLLVLIPTLLVLIFTPAVVVKVRWTALGAIIAGLAVIIVCIVALAGGEGYVPGVALVLSLMFTYFSFRAYRQK
jgi:hypothetical protein